MSGLRYRWPNGSTSIPRVTSEFNPARRNPVTGIIQPHQGIDLIGFSRNLSIAAGVVTFARYNGGAGNEVRVRHDDGTESRYKHNARILVRVGQRVEQGTALGVMGTTGQSTGIHLHLETRTAPTRAAINPRSFMSPRIRASLASGGTSTIRTTEEIPMKVNKRNEGTPEWSLIHPSLVGTDSKQEGYIVTTDPDRAREWARMYARGFGTEDHLSRADYIRQQEEAREVRKAWLRGQPAQGSITKILEAIAALPVQVAKAVRTAIIRD